MRAVNLIPSESRTGATRGAGRSGGGAYALLAVLAGLAILAFLYGSARHQVSDRRTQAASLTARAESAQAEAAKLAPYTSFAALREQRTQAVSDLVDARFDWAHAFHELGRVLPKDATIRSLDGTVGSTSSSGATSRATPSVSAGGAASTSTGAAGASATKSATPPGSVPTFTLSGCATSQQEVALTIQRLRLIDGVSEVALQSSTKSGAGAAAGSGGAGSAGASGGCEPSDPAFTVQITFVPLPSPTTIKTATARTAQNGAPR